MRAWVFAAAIAAAVAVSGAGLLAPAGALYDPDDEWEGLPEAKGREEVYFNCIACHSTAIIQQQRFSGRVWNEVLDWMVEEQGMHELDEQDRDLIIAYLVEHFGPDSPR